MSVQDIFDHGAKGSDTASSGQKIIRSLKFFRQGKRTEGPSDFDRGSFFQRKNTVVDLFLAVTRFDCNGDVIFLGWRRRDRVKTFLGIAINQQRDGLT